MSGSTAGPTHDHYDDVERRTITIHGRDGVPFDALLYMPRGPGPFPAVAIGAEGTGVNHFIKRVGATLAHLGFVALVVDPYRDDGPPDPEAYEDFDTLMSYIDALDFVRATTDLLGGVAHLRSLADVDPDRVSVWGYCTGGTLAMMAASLDRRVASAVLFYPSQPFFESLDDRTPAHPFDLLWAIRCPTLMLYGDKDVVMPPDRFAELRRRLAIWHVDHELAIFPGAGHAFCSEAPSLFHDQAAGDGWARAASFLQRAASAPHP